MAENFEPMLERLTELARQEELAALERRVNAQSVARRVAAALRAGYPVGRVWLVGSMAAPKARITPYSDLDILVEGLPPAELITAGRIAEQVAADFAVDLIRLEEVESFWREVFLREGVVL